MNWAWSSTNRPARANIAETSHIAEAMALRRVMHSSAEPIAQAEKNQKTAVTRSTYSPRGSAGSQSVDTGWVWATSRSWSYTNRSREYSAFS